MVSNTDYIDSVNVVENEIKHIRNIDTIIKMAVIHIDEQIDNIDFLENDPDFIAFEEMTIEFSFLDIRVWVDIRLQNDSCHIEFIDIKDNNDNDYLHLSKMLTQDLIKYYSKESIQRAYSYNQALEIQHDQSDPYNIKPEMPSGYGVNPKYLQDLKSICEEEESKLLIFLTNGFAGRQLRLSKSSNTREVVKTVLPIIFSGSFGFVNKYSSKLSIAQFIQSNFISYKGGMLNMGTLKNEISHNYYSA